MAVNTTQQQTQQPSVADHARRRFSVAEYMRMGQAGILTEDDRVELIDGDICQMNPIGPLHAATVEHLRELIASQLGPEFKIRGQNPIELNDYSQPQPDLAVVRARGDHYKESHPRPVDTLLVIEVADESEEYDRQEKIPRYAAAGIPETWLVTVGRAAIEQYTEPRSDRYRNVRILKPGDVLTCQSGPSLQMAVKEIFT